LGLRNAPKVVNDIEIGLSATPITYSTFRLTSIECGPKNYNFIIGGLRGIGGSSKFTFVNSATKSSTSYYSACQKKRSYSRFSLRNIEGFAINWRKVATVTCEKYLSM
jgi:hypothetical protein